MVCPCVAVYNCSNFVGFYIGHFHVNIDVMTCVISCFVLRFIDINVTNLTDQLSDAVSCKNIPRKLTDYSWQMPEHSKLMGHSFNQCEIVIIHTGFILKFNIHVLLGMMKIYREEGCVTRCIALLCMVEQELGYNWHQ